MADDCNPLIADSFAFPLKPSNRPALDRIRYRIGRYPDMLEAMTRHIDREVALAAWTHRDPDDPAIAMLQGAAILGEILTFYQEHYANEAYLRTAAWRESIADLVRLSGYRLSPAIGGKATLAIEVKPGGPITIPAGWPVKADLEERPEPGEFQTVSELRAWPHLSKFRLYRARNYSGTITSGASTVEVASAGNNATPDAIAALDLKAGDRLMLISDPPTWESSGTNFSATQTDPQILTIKEMRDTVGRTLITFETPFDLAWSVPVRAYRLGRSFRHFGQAAPPTYTSSIKDTDGEITGTREHTTAYMRHVHSGNTCSHTSSAQSINNRDLPLDQEVRDLSVGGQVVVGLKMTRGSAVRDLTVVRRITRLTTTTTSFGQQTGPSTILRIHTPPVRHSGISDAMADVRDIMIHEVTSPKIELRPEATGYGGTIPSGTDALWFYGLQSEVREIAGRRITLVHDEDGTVETLTNVNEPAHFSGSSHPRMWPLSFDAPPGLFLRSDFQEETPEVSVYGNLVDLSEGKAVPMEVLGNGDARAVFQTFKLPKPLTYHLSPGATPPETPEVMVYVAGLAWKRVSSLFGQPPDAQVYIVREDADGTSWVQFGDGLTGARVPSGIGNVTATMRTGSGARGPLKAGADPSQTARIAEVRKLAIPQGVFGGADAEAGGNARIAAPGKVQGLDRLVSLSDYESELLAIPGIERVRADWDLRDGVPGVSLRVLLEAGREEEFETVRASVASFQKCRGPNRFAIFVEQAFLAYCYVDITYGLAPTHIEAEVAAAITAALAPMDATMDATMMAPEGLFAARARHLGGPEYATRIEGIVNEIPGVTHVRLTALGRLSTSRPTDPAPLLPASPRPLASRLSVARNELLALQAGHLTLTTAPPDTAGECA